MKIILKKDVANLGDAGEVVEVKTGYALNYLVPQGFATIGTPSALKQHEETIRQRAHKEAKNIAEAQAKAAKIAAEPVNVAVKVGESGKLYGSVTAAQVANALVEKGFEVDKKNVEVPEIKEPVFLFCERCLIGIQTVAREQMVKPGKAPHGHCRNHGRMLHILGYQLVVQVALGMPNLAVVEVQTVGVGLSERDGRHSVHCKISVVAATCPHRTRTGGCLPLLYHERHESFQAQRFSAVVFVRQRETSDP